MIDCKYLENCSDKTKTMCRECKNNKKRNYIESFFEPANDKDIPKEGFLKIELVGRDEYQFDCPVCDRNISIAALCGGEVCKSCGLRVIAFRQEGIN